MWMESVRGYMAAIEEYEDVIGDKKFTNWP